MEGNAATDRDSGTARRPTDAQLRAAADACAGTILRTPLIEAHELSDRVGRRVVLKAESLQRTGSFKLRGATAKIAALGDDATRGIVAASAGNHARAVAYAARAAGVPCEVFMPSTAAITKVEATRALGATVRAEWDIVDDAIAAAAAHAERTNRPLVHPFDDLDVIAGQATLGQEIVEDVRELAAVIVPLGGGGLLAGIGVALERAGSTTRLIGVRSVDAPPRAPGGAPVPARASVADGIAVRTKGLLTIPLVEQYVDDIVRVDDDDTAEAIVHLFERAKLVVEGAGAVGVAAVLRGLVDLDLAAAPDGTIVVVLSGGNIDPGVFGDAIRRHEIKVGRRLAIVTRLDDRPGALVSLLTGIADLGANVLDIDHQRDGIDLPFGTTAVQLVVQTRDRAHGEAVLAWARDAGFDIARVFGG